MIIVLHVDEPMKYNITKNNEVSIDLKSKEPYTQCIRKKESIHDMISKQNNRTRRVVTLPSKKSITNGQEIV